MIAGLDSSGYHPTLDQVLAAHNQGVRVWGKYLPGPHIYSGDTKADYDLLKAGGMKTIAFCSGWADPAQMKALGQAWGVDFLCLDVEGGIRGGGPWIQGWLDASGAGLYANPGGHGYRAPFYIMADYLGTYPNYRDPQATWLGAAPAAPHGWQWAGSVDAFGGGVDRLWLDDWFASASARPQGDDDVAYFMTPDPNPEGIQWICKDLTMGPKRRVWDPAQQTAYAATMTDTGSHIIPRFVFDAMPDELLTRIDAAVQWAINDPNDGLVAVKAELDAIQAQVQKLAPGAPQGPSTPVDLSSVTAALKDANTKLDRLVKELNTP